MVVVQGPTGTYGTIYFDEVEGGVRVHGSIEHLTEGPHGFHIHAKGDLSNGCASTGPHFNPYNVSGFLQLLI